MESALPVSRVKPSSKERDKVCMKKNDEELFALIKEKLYTPVVGDILDRILSSVPAGLYQTAGKSGSVGCVY